LRAYRRLALSSARICITSGCDLPPTTKRHDCCRKIAISRVIPDERPVRFRAQVGVLTTAYRRETQVCCGEVTWTCCRRSVLVAAITWSPSTAGGGRFHAP